MKSMLCRAILSLVTFGLAACTLMITPPTLPAVHKSPEGACTRTAPDTRLLLNGLHGYCVQAPSEYDIAVHEWQVSFASGSFVNMGGPRADIALAEGEQRTIAEIAAERLSQLAEAGQKFTTTTTVIGGEVAYVLEHATGQDLIRQVLIVRQGRLYTLTFTPADRRLSEPYQQMERLYATIMASFGFIPQ